MIVTSQHSFPFSASENGTYVSNEPSENNGGMTFAALLKKAENFYEPAMEQARSRDEEFFNESILNENNDYRVVPDENGVLVTEKRSTDNEFVHSDSKSEDSTDESDVSADQKEAAVVAEENKDKKTDVSKDKEEVQKTLSVSEAKKGKDSSDSEKKAVGADLKHISSEEKQSLIASIDNSQRITGEKAQKGSLHAADSSHLNGKNTEAAGGESQKTETLRKAETVAAAVIRSDAKAKTKNDAGRETLAADGKAKAVPKESETANRLDRIVTISVLREEAGQKGEGALNAGKKGEGVLNAGKNRVQGKMTAGEEKNTELRSDKSVFESTSLPTSIQSGKEAGIAENAALRHITKADLIRELKDQGSVEILREAKILVKEGQSGEIKLVLRPQELGTVKINLILENKHIVGRIFVENNIVKEALQTAFGDLKEVFAQQGMELGALDVFVSQESREDFWQAENDDADTMPFKLAQAVGAVEKHAPVVTVLEDYSRVNIEV